MTQQSHCWAYTLRKPELKETHPWDSPGKNTGVGCHFLLQCMKVKSEREVAQSCVTLRDPMDCSPPGSSIHGIFQARVLEWGAIAFSKYIGYMYIYTISKFSLFVQPMDNFANNFCNFYLLSLKCNQNTTSYIFFIV